MGDGDDTRNKGLGPSAMSIHMTEPYPTNIPDETHNPRRRSFVKSSNGHSDFPIQNLPFGVFLGPRSSEPSTGIAIGDEILDLRAAYEKGLFDGDAEVAGRTAVVPPLNAFLALGADARRALRRRVSSLLAEDSANEELVRTCLRPATECTMLLPLRIGDYSDFYVGINHATKVGQLFRPDNPLLPNYKHVPIGYHGRASSIVPSGVPVRRPNGQTKAPDADGPSFGPTQRLDYELEVGIFVGRSNDHGQPIGIGEAADHIGGYCLLNDWSSRDVQAWEYQPLGPFLSKSFGSTLSPWIVTPEALAPFRVAQPLRPDGDPQPLPYLLDETDQREGALDVNLEVAISTAASRDAGLPAETIARSSTRHMYWTPAQMIAHHASGGCNLQPGDLFGSGTISGPTSDTAGSLLEATDGGKNPIRLVSGEERVFLQDGDEVILRAFARREGYVSIGFGECRARILPAHTRR
jgi:fumarylacetoacetase